MSADDVDTKTPHETPRIDSTLLALMQAAAGVRKESRAEEFVKGVGITILILSGLAIAVGLGAGAIRWGFGLG